MELLEREAQLAMLNAALAEVSAGNGRIALVSGEAGIGKTALVERFTRSQGNAAWVFWGGCDSLFTPRPLGPLHDMAPQIGGDLPELLHADVPRSTAFSTVLGELQRRPAIAVFEDVHWADEATLDLLRFLGRRISRTSALLVMTYRDDELDPQHKLRIVLGDLASSSVTRHISLPPLTTNAVRTLAGEQDVDAAALHRQTGGNPFYVTEVLAKPTGGNPPTVRDAVLARAARLSRSGHAVLDAAAVIGTRIEPWLLASVTRTDVKAVDECMAVGMLLAQGDALSFRHELAREILLETISPPRRQALHRLVLDALKTSIATRRDLARLAHHAEATGDGEAVLEYAPAAARQASSAGAHREAAALYALALRFAESLPPTERALLLEARSWECNVTDQRAEGIAARRQALELWRNSGDRLKQGENMAQLVPMLRGIGQNTEAERVSRAAIELLEELPPGRELALAYRMQAVLSLSNRDSAEAAAWGERAIGLAEQFGDIDVLAMAHTIVGSARLYLDYEQGRAYLERRLAISRETEREIHAANTFAYLGSFSAELHQFHHAERYLAEGIAYAAERDLDALSLYMLPWQAFTHLHLGRWSEAADVADEVLQRQGVSTINRITALVTLGRLRVRRGEKGAHLAFSEALELAMQTGNIQYIGQLRAARAEAAWLDGEPKRTLEEASAVYDLAVSKQHPWIAGELVFWAWRASGAVTVPDWIARPFALHIAGDWRSAAAEWARLGCPYELACALADGDTSAQIAALEIFERLGARPAAAALREKLQAADAPQLPRKPRSSTRQNPFSLTNRQVEILGLLVEGLSNAEIAARLHISPKTVDHHVSAVLAKLDVRSRKAAAAQARQHPHFTEK